MCARPTEPGPLRSVQAEAAPARTVGRSASCGGPEGRGETGRIGRIDGRRAKNHQSLSLPTSKQTAATAELPLNLSLSGTMPAARRASRGRVRAQRGEASSGFQSPGPSLAGWASST
jgi:hypothetical protein